MSPKNTFFIGVDVGTGSARAGVFDANGALLGSAAHPIAMNRPKPDFVEQDSENIWQSVCQSVRDALAQSGTPADQVAAIGFDATCSLVIRDQDNRPLGVTPDGDDNWDVIVWMDHRAVREAEECTATGAQVLKYIGGTMSPEMEVPKLMWLKRHHPDHWNKMGAAYDLADFLSFRATGNTARSCCSLTCKWTHLAHQDDPWDRDFLSQIGLEDFNAKTGIDAKALAVGDLIGTLSEQGAADLGLTTDCVVGAGLIDAHAGALGTLGEYLDGNLDQHFAMIAGTSTCHMALSSEPRFIKGVWGPYFGAIAPGLWLNEGGQSATGALLDHVVAMHPFSHGMGRDAHKLAGEKLLPMMQEKADLAPRLHVLPDFHGNRSPLADPEALGVISGLTLDQSEESFLKLYWATACAIAYGTRHIIDALNDTGYDITHIHLSGGHTASAVLVKLYADITGCTVVMSDCEEPVLLGSAMLAAGALDASNGSGGLANAARKMAGKETSHAPDTSAKADHDRRYAVFHMMHAHRKALDAVSKP
ncbi:FGGY-family carbohydrate kinase [Thalassospira lucentensis]|uniref:FGGY-family carbohydrate kinase n=1 Tax=Thalassospira lucentensis TaxID=168935 RepID=UPI00142DB9AB|nr:FGGY-family carbohydrate kinase [Thalassospira lucentensis]NIZ01165.1 FGGY-family carbohydrate kinase [Thalassospira lucentensis]